MIKLNGSKMREKLGKLLVSKETNDNGSAQEKSNREIVHKNGMQFRYFKAH